MSERNELMSSLLAQSQAINKLVLAIEKNNQYLHMLICQNAELLDVLQDEGGGEDRLATTYLDGSAVN